MTPDDPFDRLALPPRFDLEPDAIRRAYLARAAQLHPDLQGQPPESGSVDSESDVEASSARLNEARRVLEDPESRANALLARLGGPDARADRSLPPGFLMEIMELRERVESMLGGGAPGDRAACLAEAEGLRRGYIEDVRSRFASLGEPASAAALGAIRTELNAWRYIERLIEQLDPAYDPSEADFGG